MESIPDQPCAHPACGCKVERAGDCCSDYCRGKNSAQIAIPCECGHSDCVIEQALQRADQG